jgi:hypothetical protein
VKNYIVQAAAMKKNWWILSLGVSLALVISALSLPGGDDLYRYYIPFANGCMDCGFVPYYAQWFLWPLRMLPQYPFAWPTWVIINALGFLLLTYFTKVNPFLFMISFPMLGQIWLGQIDILVCLGLVIFMFAKNPYIRGCGIGFALSKPQLTALPIFYCLLLENPKALPRLAVFPVLVFVTSLLPYGMDWPVSWIRNAVQQLPIHVWRLASIDIWRFGIFLIPAPLLIRNQKKRLEAALLVSALATPFFGIYSYVTFLIFNTKWWNWALSYAWLIGYYWFRESAMRFAWILPLGMLFSLLYDAIAERRRTPVKTGEKY